MKLTEIDCVMVNKPTYEELEKKVAYLHHFINKMQSTNIHNEAELFRLGFENANIGMCLVDLKGNLFKVNAQMTKIFGYSIEELEQMNVNDITHPDFNTDSPEFIKNATEGTISNTEFEKNYFHKNGSVITSLVRSSSVMDKENNALFFISHVQDITDKKNAEKILLEQKEELQKLNSEKDKFFSIIAHDLMNPFNSIISFSNLLEEQVKNKEYDEVEVFSKIIHQSSQRAMNLLINLMEWSQSQTGRMDYNPVFFDLENLINEVTLLFSEISKQKSITLKKSFALSKSILADRDMISAVLRNLISNAIKFTKTEGSVIISVVENNNNLIFSISDNGVGIEQERIEKLFQLTENYSTLGTEKEKGTGLGLILCKDFIEKHNGKIWVDSKIEKGTTINFSIPIFK
jgi:PAS domain S-box-containing protein